MWIFSAGLRYPVSPEFRLSCGAELNRAGSEYDMWIGETFHIMATRSIEYGLNAGAEFSSPVSSSASLLLRIKAHWLPDPEAYFITASVGLNSSSMR